MRVIFSPSKTMRQAEHPAPEGLPPLLPRTEILLRALRALPEEELRQLYGCSEAIARENHRRLAEMELREGLSPALFSFEGLAFRHMEPESFGAAALGWAREHLRILSGFYGLLRPLDGVRPYRLDPENPLSLPGCRNLYEFWGSAPYEALEAEDGVILDLASEEYSRLVGRALRPGDRLIRCRFAEESGGRLRQKATFAKMARGEMLRFLALRQAEGPEEARDFRELGFRFREELSGEAEYVFTRAPEG